MAQNNLIICLIRKSSDMAIMGAIIIKGWSSHFKGFSMADCRTSTNRWTKYNVSKRVSLIYLYLYSKQRFAGCIIKFLNEIMLERFKTSKISKSRVE